MDEGWGLCQRSGRILNNQLINSDIDPVTSTINFAKRWH
jgi:hypothetical protein